MYKGENKTVNWATKRTYLRKMDVSIKKYTRKNKRKFFKQW